MVPAVTPSFSGATFLAQQKVPYFGWALSSDFCGNVYGFGFSGCPFPERVTSNAWGVLVRTAFGPPATARTAAILTESSPTGQYELQSLTSGITSAKLEVVYGKASLALPATLDFNAVAKEVLASNAGKPPDSVFVVGNVSNVLGMQNALRANGFLGVITNPLMYGPNLVAPAIGSMVMTQTAPVESAATNPAMAQLVADVQKVVPGQPIDQSVIAGYWSADLFLAAVQEGGQAADGRVAGEGGEPQVHLPGAEHGRPDDVPRRALGADAVRRAGGEQRHRLRGEGAVHLQPPRAGQVARWAPGAGSGSRSPRRW